MVFCVLYLIPKYMCSFRWINIQKLTDVGMTKGTRVQTLLIRWLSEFLKHVSSQLWFPVTSGARTANPPGSPEFTPSDCWIRVGQSSVVCRSLFVLLSLFFWTLYYLSLFQSTASDYPFGIIKCSLSILTGGYTVR
jgi:hypothetical protein